jgi:Zn-finger nucleic acid-binding protein
LSLLYYHLLTPLFLANLWTNPLSDSSKPFFSPLFSFRFLEICQLDLFFSLSISWFIPFCEGEKDRKKVTKIITEKSPKNPSKNHIKRQKKDKQRKRKKGRKRKKKKHTPFLMNRTRT